MTLIDPFVRLVDVTFCVLDLETTGTADEVDEIVEIGAVKVRGGERLGTFQTMVRHSLSSGTSERPSIDAVLASLLEFVRGSVIVGHNIRFDLRFLNSALWRAGREDVLDPSDAIDTMVLARRLLRDDADDCRLGTLARRFSFEERPTHRALADAAATVELLHLVIERATHYGVFDLDDLIRLPSLMRHRHRARLAVTAAVPRVQGVARLLDRHGEVLHVVDGPDVRHEVRRLFDPDDPLPARRVPARVVHHVHRIEHLHVANAVATEIAAMRWRSATPAARREPHAYLRRPGTGVGRLVSCGDRTSPGVVAGPLPRDLARRAVVELAAAGLVEQVAFFDELRDARGGGRSSSSAALAEVIARQHALDRGRGCSGALEVADAVVFVDRGRVRDVVADGRSWADVLPEPDLDSPDLPLTPAAAAEATWIARLMDRSGQPGCEILDSWSPQ
ncbi:MAG: exonuclease domain-containing protein [Ilumatobacteraceae bacterium]